MAFIKLPEGAAPSTPATGTVIIYAKADGYFYSKDDAGTETKLGAGIGLADANTFTAQQSFTGTAATAPAIAGASDPNTGVFFPAADTVAVSTAGVERMRIDTSGNVGVGVTPSAWGASWKSVDNNSTGGFASNGTSLAIVSQNLYNNGTNWIYKTTAAASMYLCGSGGLGSHSFYNAVSDTAGNAATMTLVGGFNSTGVWTWNNPVASGYGTGAGGTVTQATSRATGVTLNKPTGAITMFSAAGSTTAATFTVTNSTVGADDCVSVCQKSGTNLYDVMVTAVAAGSFNITFRTTGGTATDAPVINFNVHKGATS